MNNKEAETNSIRDGYKCDEITYMDAIEQLEKLGYSSHEAEELVQSW